MSTALLRRDGTHRPLSRLASRPESPHRLAFRGLAKAKRRPSQEPTNAAGLPHPLPGSPDPRGQREGVAASRPHAEAANCSPAGCIASAVWQPQAFKWMQECSRMYATEQQLGKSLKHNINPQIVIIYLLRLINGQRNGIHLREIMFLYVSSYPVFPQRLKQMALLW